MSPQYLLSYWAALVLIMNKMRWSSTWKRKKQALPAEFYDGKSVLVGAYGTLFNGRSKFGVRGSRQEVVKEEGS